MEPVPSAGTAGSAALDDRSCEVAENRPSGGYRIVSLRDRAGSEPLPGQFYLLTPTTGLGEAAGGALDPRPVAIAAVAPAARGVRLDFLVEDGDGDGLGELAAGDEVRVAGPLGTAFAAPHDLRPGAAGAVLVGAGAGIGPLALLRRRLSERAVPLRVLLGFPDGTGAGGLELFCGTGAELCPEVRLASGEERHARRGTVTDLLAVLLEGDDSTSAVVYGCGPAAMLETVSRLCAERDVACELRPQTPGPNGSGPPPYSTSSRG
jgi:dihydroorotate dehydrogenase electron transfer subunit